MITIMIIVVLFFTNHHGTESNCEYADCGAIGNGKY
jgi:hypothetical protein